MARQPVSPRGHQRSRRLIRQIDRTTGHINPYLFAVAIGLLVLYVTCLVAVTVRLPPIHLRACVAAQPEASAARPR